MKHFVCLGTNKKVYLPHPVRVSWPGMGNHFQRLYKAKRVPPYALNSRRLGRAYGTVSVSHPVVQPGVCVWTKGCLSENTKLGSGMEKEWRMRIEEGSFGRA
eukprot:scaffold28921_cov191-Amphora_coffeaeformis.AAC.3